MASRISDTSSPSGIGTPTWAGGRSLRSAARRRVRWSDRAAARAGATGHGVHDDDHDDRADDRDHDRADVERAVDRMAVEENAREEPADERADDPENDVTDHAEALVTADEEAGEIPGNRAEDDPGNQTHGFRPPSQSGALCSPGVGTVRMIEWASRRLDYGCRVPRCIHLSADDFATARGTSRRRRSRARRSISGPCIQRLGGRLLVAATLHGKRETRRRNAPFR